MHGFEQITSKINNLKDILKQTYLRITGRSLPPTASALLVTCGRREIRGKRKKKRRGVFLQQLKLPWSPVAGGKYSNKKIFLRQLQEGHNFFFGGFSLLSKVIEGAEAVGGRDLAVFCVSHLPSATGDQESCSCLRKTPPLFSSPFSLR